MAEQKTAWLIERGSPAEYLTLYGYAPEYELLYKAEGVAGWSHNVEDAIRFVRARDAMLVLAILRTLYGELPSKHGVRGLRAHDDRPRVCEHLWCDGPTNEPEQK